MSPLSDWKQQMLHRRSDLNDPAHRLTDADGRPLYRYRISDREFGELESLLKKYLTVSDIAQASQDREFSALFVMYAAEWWRRRYDGSGPSWDPILHDLGHDPRAWTPAQRQNCVGQGFQRWRLSLQKNGALRFIVGVAVQGGLPLKLLEKSSKSIGLLVDRVLRVATNTHVTFEEIRGWVESQQDCLAKSYRQDPIFYLLTEMIHTTLKLKDEAGITASSDAIALLEQKVPNWKEQYPLPVDNDHAEALIKRLIRDAANIRVREQTPCLSLERNLRAESDGSWSLLSHVRAKSQGKLSLTTADLESLFCIKQEELPRVATLLLSAGFQQKTVSLRRLSGTQDYRVTGELFGYADEISIREHTLCLSASDGRSWSSSLARGETLDEDLPWVFGDDENQYLFLRQGGGRVPHKSVRLVVPPSWSVLPQDPTSEATCLGELQAISRKVWRVCGAVKIQNSGGDHFQIKTGQADATEESYEWQGNRCWFSFVKPALVFFDFPQLRQVFPNGSTCRLDKEPSWSLGKQYGPVVARYPAQGEVQCRTRMVVLPAGAKITLHPDPRSKFSGEIHLEGWNANSIRIVETSSVHGSCQRHGNAVILKVSASENQMPPEWLEAEVSWPHTTETVYCKFPFPAKGARIFDKDGNVIQPDSVLAVDSLLGIRIRALLGSRLHQDQGGDTCAQLSGIRIRALLGSRKSQNVSLQLDLGSHTKRIPLQFDPDQGESLEIHPHDYFDEIQYLFAIGDELDDNVQVHLKADADECCRFWVSRYGMKLNRNSTDAFFNSADVAKLPQGVDIDSLCVKALRLERPADEPIQLRPTKDGVVPFESETREPGAWLIYPEKETPLSLRFRPLLFTVRGDADAGSRLAQVIGVRNPEQREKDLDVVIAEMSNDFLSPCWNDVECTIQHLGHLPLVALDLWKRFAHSPQAMAAFAMRFWTLPQDFLERFSRELPFVWEVVSFREWKHAVQCLQKQCTETFGESAGEIVFRAHLDSRVASLSDNHHSLQFLLGIVAANCKPDTQAVQDTQRIKTTDGRTCLRRRVQRETTPDMEGVKAVGRLTRQFLFEGDDSEAMKLRRRHEQDSKSKPKWPKSEKLTGIFREAEFNPSTADFLYYKGAPEHQRSMIHLPVLLAAQVAMDKVHKQFREKHIIRALREHYNFDPDWFEEAFDRTIAQCFAEGKMQPQKE